MNELDAILLRLQENEEITKKFHRVETKILSILNFKDLFEVLLTEIQDNFKVPYVWISMVENSEISSLIESLGSSDLLKEHINLIDKDVFLDLIEHHTDPILANKKLKPYFKLFPQNRKFFIKSLAVAPITLDGEIIGSLNQADASPSRFQPGMDTSLLQQLALKVSICLSNVTAHEKLKFLAYHDPLTGLLNRRVMENILEREVQRARRYRKPLSVVFADLDFFKHFNDTYGHERGDDILVFVADTLLKMSRQSDIVARFAGDEFVLILPETDAQQTENLMERIVSHFKVTPYHFPQAEVHVSISYGMASSTEGETDLPEELLKKADERLYQRKRTRDNVSPRNLVTPIADNKVINLSVAAAEKNPQTE
ncbi:MAG: GGDEF domain-containing protein [Thermodesulfobacteriota bacterium]